MGWESRDFHHHLYVERIAVEQNQENMNELPWATLRGSSMYHSMASWKYVSVRYACCFGCLLACLSTVGWEVGTVVENRGREKKMLGYVCPLN